MCRWEKDVPERKADTIHFSLFHRGDLCQGREPATKTEAVQSEDKAPGATGDQLSTQQHAGACPVCPVSFQ